VAMIIHRQWQFVSLLKSDSNREKRSFSPESPIAISGDSQSADPVTTHSQNRKDRLRIWICPI
jgi:hypothetical protein